MKNTNKSTWYKHGFIIAIITLLTIAFIIHLCLILFTRFTRTITIKSKEGYGSGKSGRTQLVTDDLGRAYSVSNALLLGHFTSAELFGALEVGKRYNIKGFGLRVPILGMFPNIYAADLSLASQAHLRE